MGLREAFVKLLARGEAPEPDPDDWCELVTVPQFEAPLVIQRLNDAEVTVNQQESFNLVTRTLTDVTILVRRSDLDAAQAAIVG